MKGQISDLEFIRCYPNAIVNYRNKTAVTFYGRSTVNYWYQHDDGSWTNYNCKTI